MDKIRLIASPPVYMVNPIITSKGEFTMRWLDISNNKWMQKSNINGGEPLEIETPGEGHQAVVIKAI